MKRISSLVIIIQLIVVLLLSFTSLYSQIRGKVIDINNEPLPYVNVVLYKVSDSLLVKGTTTNELGEFSVLHTVPGNYLLELSSIGFTNYYSENFSLTQESLEIDLETITLTENINELDEVVVATNKEWIQNTPIGKVINVQSSLMTKGSNTLQVLEKLPGILLDKRNNQFSLNGQSGVTVMFNGRKMPMSMEDLMALLESTVADNIDKIELITSPTSKYDADGGAGIINIVFKQNENGNNQFNFSSSIGYGYKEKASTSLNYSYSKKKTNINTSYSIFHNKSKNGFEGSGTSNMPILEGASQGTFSTYYHNNLTTQNLNFVINYQLNPKTEIGGEMLYSFAKNGNVTNISNGRNIENQEFFQSQLLSEGESHKNNLISSIFLGKKFSDKAHLNIDLNYLFYSNNSPNQVASRYFNEQNEPIIPDNEIFTDGNRSESKSTIKVGVIKADYALKINDNIDSEFGAKGSYTTNYNDSKIETNNEGVWEIDPRSQSILTSDEKLWAVYSQIKLSLSEKATINAGVRYEYWNRNISNNNDTFTIKQFFPNFSYQYAYSDNSNLNLNYTRRISRPTYVDLVASLFYNDPTAVFTGNPLLKPTIIDVLKLEYSKKGFNVGISAQNEENPIVRYQLTSTPQNDILLVSPQNAEYQKSLNLFLNYPIQWAHWAKLSLSTTTSLRKYKISYSPNPAKKTYLNQSVNFTQTFKLPFEMDMEFSGWRNFNNYNGTNKTKGFGVVNFGVSKKLKNDKGTIQFTIDDVFKSFDIYTHISGMTPIVFDIDTRSRYRDESGLSRIFKLTYSRSFGGNSMSRKRKSGVEEEKNRVN